MDKFNRELQEKILKKCVDVYPSHTNFSQFTQEFNDYNEDMITANIIYLAEHELINIRKRTSDDPYTFLDNMRATVSGIDFMLNDGGLSAILSVQTFRLHHESIAALEDIIAVSNIPEDQKQGLKAALQGLPADTIKHLMNELVSKALVAAPAALPIIQRFLLGG